MYYLENSDLYVKVSDLGAELKGIRLKRDHREYVWQPGDDIWNHSSLLLFPNPGRIRKNRVIIDGEVYPAKMHGFACDSMFTVVEQTEDTLELELASGEQTKTYLPYDFRLRVRYELHGNCLHQKLIVMNDGQKQMYFGIGVHPGFYIPMELGEQGEDYVLRFDTPQNLFEVMLHPATKLRTGEERPWLEGQEIQLREDFFNNGPILLGNVAADYVTLLSKKTGHYMKFGIDRAPHLCLWGSAYQSAMICIEPWFGISDTVDADHCCERRKGIQSLGAGELYRRLMTYEVG